MTFLTITDEQARLIAEASTPIVVVDSRGREVGKLQPIDAASTGAAPLSAEDVAELKRRINAPGPGKSTKELLEHLQAIAPIEGR